MPPLVTVVIPVLGDYEAAAGLVAQLPTIADIEVVIVDGGDDSRLESLAALHPHGRLLRTISGRGHQMNVGAADAPGEWLMFLHADSKLPEEWFEHIRLLGADIVGGWFRFALDDAAWQARVIERFVAWRIRWMRLPYGDQGLFVRRRVFHAIGGFRDMPLLEDVDFARRLIRVGPVAELPVKLRTSARRWRRDGWLRRSIRNGAIVALYFAGVPATQLAHWYRSSARE
jgi:rSAM/selenodomain-associated transferase 2